VPCCRGSERAVEVIDAVAQVVLKALRQALPDLGPGDLALGQLGKRNLDLGDRQPDALAGERLSTGPPRTNDEGRP